MLFLGGVYVDSANGSSARFRWVKAPTSAELTQLTHTIAQRVGRLDARHPWRAPCGRTACVQIRSWRICLERRGLLERDAENSYLAGEAVDAGPLDELLGHSITYRIAVGPQQGRKVFTLQTLPGCEEPFDDALGKVAGFSILRSVDGTSLCHSSLHAGVAARADERKKLERLCRYIARPAVSERRLSLTTNGNVRYQLKTPYRDGTTHVIFEPLDLMGYIPVPHP